MMRESLMKKVNPTRMTKLKMDIKRHYKDSFVCFYLEEIYNKKYDQA